MFIARDIVKAEEKQNTKLLDKLKDIEANTCKELLVPLSVVEAYYVSNWISLSKSIELRNNHGRIVELPVYRLKYYLDQSYMEMRDIVRQIAIKYSIDIPYRDIVGEEGGEVKIG